MNNFQKILCDHFEKSFAYIFHFAFYASRRYKVYFIPKRTGGLRKISHPSRELKKYQRYLASKIFAQFPVHNSVYSYQHGKNIKQMALRHANSNYLLRIDFKDFFPSIKADFIRKFLYEKSSDLDIGSLEDNDITLINLLVCKGGCLTIGAPSSPIISNILLYELDEFLDQKCRSMNIIYTRYADDLYFSCMEPDVLNDILPMLKEYLKSYFVRLKINESKTVNTSRKRRRTVTGLTLTSDKKVSIGRQKKRYIKSLIYKYYQKKATRDEINYLSGYMSYLYSIEPEYIENLRNKYSSEIINALLPLK